MTPPTDSDHATVVIPRQLREVFSTAGREPVPAGTVAGAIASLDARYPGIAERILEEGGGPRRYVNIFLNGQPIADLGGMDAELEGPDLLWIIPAVAGG
jgi:molybdopterin converting factor small subunit